MGSKFLHEFRATFGTKKLWFCDSSDSTCWPVAFRQFARFWRPDELWGTTTIHQPTRLYRAAIRQSVQLWGATAVHQPTRLYRTAIQQSAELWGATAIHQPARFYWTAIQQSARLWGA